MPIYMKYGDIKGEVTSKGHENWVEVHSFQYGVGRGIGAPTGRETQREHSAPSVSEIVVTKAADKSSVYWMERALWGEGEAVTIDFVKTDKDKLEIYTQYLLENAMVSGFSVSSGGDRPQESISINFTKIIFNYTEMKAKNEKGETPKTMWDLGKATAG
jgi:type VI secretion system secreted protein Hcp